MWPELAGRLSRVLVGWHPRRWRDRYGEEMLDVLDQHRPTARTVVNLWASAVSAQLDPAYRTDRLSLARLRRAALISAAIAAPLALVLASVGYRIWYDGYWHPAADEGLAAVAFSPRPAILVTAFGVALDGTDIVWDVTDLSRPRLLSQFEGGQPMVLSPDGRTVATVTFGRRTALWNVADPRHPARIATLPDTDGNTLWGQAFSPDGKILATGYYDGIALWDVTRPARPRLLRSLNAPLTSPAEAAVGNGGKTALGPQAIAFAPGGRILTVVVDRAEMSANSGRDTIFDWPVTGSGALGAVTVAGRDVADNQPFIAPGDRTVLGGPGGSRAWYAWRAWPLP